MHPVIDALGGRLAFGGDYNPEQWPEQVWVEDVALMRQAGVTMVTVGVFSWASLEPEPGRYEFGWLDRVLDLLHGAGIAVDLATATASPPAWFGHHHPDALLVDETGTRRAFGARQNYCPSSPVYRAAAAALAGRIAQRYADHPAVVMWHVNNEYGCHNWHCYCETSAVAFRDWLRARYSSLDALNHAWGTAFWSQRYADWAHVSPPRQVAYNTFANPGQQLDWWRFSSDELRECFRAEAAAVRGFAAQPLTTNFMGFFKPIDYRRWVDELDVISNDHYLRAEDPDNAQELAMTDDLLRSLADGAPWLVMEHSTSAVNWQPRNLAKRPGELRRNSLQHVARGSDGAMFFQWRASAAGAEKFHSGLVPHAGTDSTLWRDVVALGGELSRLAEVAGSRVEPAHVALLFDWPSWWAAELDSHPSVDVDPLAETRRWHDALWARNATVDFAGAGSDLSGYRLVVVPVQYLMDAAAVAALAAFVAAGGTLVVTYFSGIVDEHDHVRLGGYPGALRDLLGVRIEEFFPLGLDQAVELTEFGPGRVWSELAAATGADVVSAYARGPVAGSPAVTRREVSGGGSAWYVGTRLDRDGLGALLDRILAGTQVQPVVPGLPRGVEAVRRVSGDRRYLFLINHTDSDVTVGVPGVDLLSGRAGTAVEVPAGGAAVVRQDGSSGEPGTASRPGG